MAPVAVFSAKGGAEPQSKQYGVKHLTMAYLRIAYVNKMDTVGADFFNVVDMMKLPFGCKIRSCLACQSALRRRGTFEASSI